MKKVYQFTMENQLVGEYESLADAGRHVGVSLETISSVCNGKRKTAKGYKWSFSMLDKLTDESCTTWKPVKGFEGRYEISDDDRVRAKMKTFDNRTMPPKEISVRVDKEGYKRCALDGKEHRIHRIKYEAFVSEIPEGMVVDHIDRNRLNNDISNLRLIDCRGNLGNRTLPYRPSILYIEKRPKPFLLRFSENGKRKNIGYYNTYEEAENKYRELYNERQERIDNARY